MAEVASPDAGPGALLRAAREQQGMHIAMLAAALKVPQSRLEALEAGRFDELPDATFARALAQSVCRVLKLDPTPVLAQLPQVRTTGLEKVSNGLNTPFRDRPGRAIPADWVPWRKPTLWAAGVLVIGAAVFVLVPPRVLTPLPQAPAASAPVNADEPVIGLPAASAAVAGDATPSAPAATEPAATASAPALSATTETSASAPRPDPATAAAQGAVLTAVQASWVHAVDARGQVLLARLIPAGETLELVGTPPIRIRVGNVAGTRLRWHGQPVDLASITRDNVATVDLR